MESISASNTSNASSEIANTLPQSLSPSAKRLFSVLVQLALDVVEDSGLSTLPTFVTFHSSLEVACAVAGISRMSGYRGCKELKELGVLDSRPYKATYKDKSIRNAGTLFCVKLVLNAGSKARLTHAEFKQPWKVAWNSYRTLLHTLEASTRELKYLLLKQHTVNPFTHSAPLQVSVTSVPPLPEKIFRGGLEAVLDVISTPKEGLNRAVDLASEALAFALRDSKGRNYYRKLLWQAVRASKATGKDYSQVIYNFASRAFTDSQEGFARKPGALFVSRLQQASWYFEVMNSPPIRVGVKPS